MVDDDDDGSNSSATSCVLVETIQEDEFADAPVGSIMFETTDGRPLAPPQSSKLISLSGKNGNPSMVATSCVPSNATKARSRWYSPSLGLQMGHSTEKSWCLFFMQQHTSNNAIWEYSN